MKTRAAVVDLPDVEYLRRPTVLECQARGLAARREVPLEAHASWKPTADRRDPVAVLEEQAATRLADLVPIRNGRMAHSAFQFFRGGAAIMAADLASGRSTDLHAQLCGDAHLLNFGLFMTPEQQLVFSVNDFDETLPGPFEWDVKRLAASVEVAARDRVLKKHERRSIVRATVRAYRLAMIGFAQQRTIDVWHARLSGDELRSRLMTASDPVTQHTVSRSMKHAMHRDHLAAFAKYLEPTDNGIRFVDHPPLLTPIEDLLDARQRRRYPAVVRGFLRQYRASLPTNQRVLLESYSFMHLARKVVGVGSVGTRCWVVLKLGRDENDPLLLQLKEAQPSVLSPYLGDTVYESQGRRVVEGQRLMQASSDNMLGWCRFETWDDTAHDFYVRQLWDGKASVDVSRLTPVGLRIYGEACGWTLARAHARSGERIAISAYLGDDSTFEQAITEFAESYADTNEHDHRQLLLAIAQGRVPAVMGV